MLDIDSILDHSVDLPTAEGSEAAQRLLGRSRQGRPIYGYQLGHGPAAVSCIGGCHADEPVGPAMLERLVSWLALQPSTSPCLSKVRWFLVPHVHPDGAARNHAWTSFRFDEPGADLDGDLDLVAYLRHVVRDLPGDDVEFGFPGSPDGSPPLPEARAVAEFLAQGAPLHLHASFHGMAFAAGPWFLMEHSWAERTLDMRNGLRDRVTDLGYRLHDVDRGGEKGFFRIDEGFTSRPDSKAMRAHFEALDDSATAALFRPSSMEYAVSLGGDPLTLVSEMPLFIAPWDLYTSGGSLVRPQALSELRARAVDVHVPAHTIRAEANRLGIRSMPLRDQMRLQLEFLAAGLRAVEQRAAEFG